MNEVIKISVEKTTVTEVRVLIKKSNNHSFHHEHIFHFPLSFYDTIKDFDDDKILFLAYDCLYNDTERCKIYLPEYSLTHTRTFK